jgi:lipopolysaccharide transport system permease protein
MTGYFSSVWRYRHFIASAIKNDFRNRFARSKIAGAWVILQPLIQAAIFAVILSSVLAAKLPNVDNNYAYALYLLAGMAAWGLFAEITGRCLNIFIENSNTLKKIVFPRICLPTIAAGIALINYLLFLFAVVAVAVLVGVPPGLNYWHLIPLSILIVAFSLGLGLFLGTLNVFMRDVGQVMSVILQLWFWFTPIVYPANIIPEQFKPVLHANPLYPVVDGFHQVILYGKPPQWELIIPAAITSVVMLIIALIVFRKAAPEMVDVL